MKPEQQIRATYADILNNADPATVRIIGDLDMLYTGTPIPSAPAFNSLVASQTAPRSVQDAGTGPAISSHAVGGPPRPSRNWLRQGFAFAGAAIAFTVVAAILVLLFRGSDDESRLGAEPTTTPGSVFEIAYVSPRLDGQIALVATRSDGSGQRTIMTGSILGQPAWSPDGRWIAIAAGGDRPAGLYIVNATTGDARQLTSTDEDTFDQLPVFSPDGATIAFIRSTTTNGSNIWLIETAGGEPRQLTELVGYQALGNWSPDGSRIAFTSIPPDSTTSDIYVISTAGGTSQQLTSNPGWDSSPNWSPDGSQIMFHSDAEGEYDIVIANQDGSNPHNLTATTPGNSLTASWSPDGEWITFLHEDDGRNTVSVMRADGSQITPLAESQSYSPGAVWSPNSLQLAFTTFTPADSNSTTPPASETIPGELHIIDRDGSNHIVLAAPVDTASRPSWSPVPVSGDIVTPEPSTTTEAALPAATSTQSPDQIAFSSTQDGNPEIYLINADGSGLTRLTDEPAADKEPTWSPDGELIAFTSDRDGEQHLYIMNADGSDARLVTDGASGVAVPVWSPDGEWIAFVAFTQDGFLDIFIVRPDGSDLRRLTDWQAIDTDPAWSPSSQQVVYRSDSGSGVADDIFIVNIDGSGRANLTNDVIPQREPQWSRDGTRIAFSHASLEVAMGEGAFGRYDTIGFYDTTNQSGVPLQTTDILGSSPHWSPDGNAIVYHRPASEPGTGISSTETVHVLDTDTLTSSQIPELEGAMPTYDWSPDGAALAIALTSVDADGNTEEARSLWSVSLDGAEPILLAEKLDSWARPAWRPDPDRAPEPLMPAPDLALPTATSDTSEAPQPVTPNTLDTLAPLQPGQERHFVFDIRADYRMDESNFLEWNVKGSQRMLPDGTLQTYMIARDEEYTVLIEYVDDGERWWWNQRGWIESGMTAAGEGPLPEELRLAMMEPHSAHRALTGDIYEQLDQRSEGNTRVTRYDMDNVDDMAWVDDMTWGERHLGTVESAYYEVYTTGDPVQVTRTRLVIVTPDDDERPEYALADIAFSSVILVAAEDDSGMYIVPDAPAAGTFQYIPPTTLPNGLLLEQQLRASPGGMERITISGGDQLSIAIDILPSRGEYDRRTMQTRAATTSGMTVATGFMAGGNIAWTYSETNNWPIFAIWDNGRYRFELSISNVTSPGDWVEDDLVALIYALAGESQPD